MKRFLTLLFLVCLMVLLAACGSKQNAAPSASSVAASAPASTAAVPTPFPTNEPLVEKELYGIRFQLPERIAATQEMDEDGTATRYYPDSSDSSAIHIAFQLESLSSYPPVSSWSDEFFEDLINLVLDSDKTLLEKGSVTVNPSAPIDARRIKLSKSVNGKPFYTEYVFLGNVALGMFYEKGYDAPFAAVWEDFLNSIELIAPPADATDENAGLRPEFKEMMDSYEAFFDEYIAFMQKYQSASGTDALSMLSSLTDYMEKYTDYMEKLNAVDQSELSTEEALYYLEVSTRINKKLLSTLS